jgi:hypothetical protein
MTDLWLNARVTALENSGGPESASMYFPMEVNDTVSGPRCIPTLYGSNLRQNSPSGSWASSDWLTTAQISATNANAISDADLFNLATGNFIRISDRTPASDYPFYNSESGIVEYAKGRVVGHNRQVMVSNYSSQQYAQFGSRVMFVRNTGDTDITKNVNVTFSSGTGNAYGGARFSVGTPNGTTYSTVDSVTWTNFTYGTDTYFVNQNYSVTFPAGKTVALMLTNTFMYWTTYTSGAHMTDRNFFSDLHLLFNDAALVPDLAMTQTCLQGNFYDNPLGASNPRTTNDTHRWFNLCATLFGDR